MTVDLRKVILVWTAICLLVPSELKIAGVNLLDLFVFSVVGLSFASWLNSGAGLRLRSKVEMSLVLFFAVIMISYFCNSFSGFEEQRAFVQSLGLSPDFLFARLTIYGVLTVLMLLGGYRIVAATMTRPEDLESVIRVVIAAGLLNAVATIGYWAATTGCRFERYNFIPPIEGSQGIHLNFMALTFLMAFALIMSGAVSGPGKLYLYGVLSLTGFSILTVMVRQGWIMFLLSIVLYFLLYMSKHPSRGNKRRMYSFAFLFLAGISLLIVYNQSMLVELFTDVFSVSGTESDQGSWLMRFALIQHGIDVFLSKPVWGVGFGHYPAYSTVPIFVSGVETFVSSPHNGVVTILAETGIAGFLSISILCFFLLRQGYLAYRHHTSKITGSLVSAVFSLLIINVFSQVISNSLILPLPTERSMTQSSFLLWILLGLIAGVAKTSPSPGGISEGQECR